METLTYAIVILAGFISGFINTLAGSGSLLTLPLLIFLGLPANVANGTNRIAIILQSIVAVKEFKQKKVFEWDEGLWLTLPATVGALIGAASAISLNNEVMNRVIGGLMVILCLLILLKPERWVKETPVKTKVKPSIMQMLLFLLIGFYGGFIQAGVGFFLLAGLVLGSGFNLLKANAVKVLIVLVYTLAALGVFIYNNQVDYKLGIILGLGSMAGAWVASHMAIKRGIGFIRWFVILVILAFSVKLLLF